MPLKNYGVLAGTVMGHQRGTAKSPHYQILVNDGKTAHRIAVNVASQAAPSEVLYLVSRTVPEAFAKKLAGLADGYQAVESKPRGLAIDFLRSGLVDVKKMKPLPPDQPGEDNDLSDKVDAMVLRAMKEGGSRVFAFGEKWGPEKTKRDQYFHFLPGNGIHDIHMNQGNSGQWKRDNGVYQDGALFFHFAETDQWGAIYLAFQSQAQVTDDETGNPLTGGGEGPKPKPKPKPPVKKKKGKKGRRK